MTRAGPLARPTTRHVGFGEQPATFDLSIAPGRAMLLMEVDMAIPDDKRNMAAGVKLVAVYKGKRHECIVTEDGFDYDGKVYTSLSKAGSVVAGGTSVNGWRFWSAEGDFVAAAPREPKVRSSTTRTGPITERVVRFIKRMDNQIGVDEGFIKYWCSACMNAFTIAKGAKSDICPRGHAALAKDDFGPAKDTDNEIGDEFK